MHIIHSMKIDNFRNMNYMNIETFRKSGEGMRTPVWFAIVDEELCLYTEAGSGKVKRMRRNPRVNVAPCKVNGDLLGDWHPGTIRFLSPTESAVADKAFSRKYGLMKTLFSLLGSLQKRKRVFIAVRLDE